jgi:hypothetical protein
MHHLNRFGDKPLSKPINFVGGIVLRSGPGQISYDLA